MDFFARQDLAHRNTRTLVVLFVVAVVMTVISVNAVILGTLHFLSVQAAEQQVRDHDYRRLREAPIQPLDWWQPGLIFVVTGATLIIILGGSAYKMASLSGGGPAVAEMLGARRIVGETTDPSERQLLNVVEEMSIASGIPVPSVYVLDKEKGINAFAAGFAPADAVVTVTRGALQNLSRDELQGVIGHEFSHILNGDIRLNLRLMGAVYGLLVVSLVGYGIMRITAQVEAYGDDDSRGWAIALVVIVLGALVAAVGWVGMFFGRLIQAAVCRQREFLADASAVQFTRNPAGICGALKKIGGFPAGAVLANHDALGVAHMLFAGGAGGFWSTLLATHPPLEDRIRALDPAFKSGPVHLASPIEAPPAVTNFDDLTAAADQATIGFAGAAPSSPSASAVACPPRAVPVVPIRLVAQVGRPTLAHVEHATALIDCLPPALRDAARDAFSARGIVYGLLLADNEAVRSKQLNELRNEDLAVANVTTGLTPALASLKREHRLPLVDLAAPALRQLSPEQASRFLQRLKNLIDADGKVTLFEYALFKLIRRRLSPDQVPANVASARYVSLTPILDEAALLLSALSAADNPAAADANAAFFRAAVRLGHSELRRSAGPLDVKSLDAALDTLAAAAPGVRARMLDACAHCVTADGVICSEESDLIRVVAATLNCPLPPMVG